VLVLLSGVLKLGVSVKDDLIDLFLRGLSDGVCDNLLSVNSRVELLGGLGVEVRKSLLVSLDDFFLQSLDINVVLNDGSVNVLGTVIALSDAFASNEGIEVLGGADTTIGHGVFLVLTVQGDSWRLLDSVSVDHLGAVTHINGSILDVVTLGGHVSGVNVDFVLEGSGVLAPVSVEGEDPEVVFVIEDQVFVVIIVDLDKTLIEGID
jgi:hypothetical protein